MRLKSLGLFAATLVAMVVGALALSAPTTASAATPAPAAAAPALPPVTADARKKGMAAAPALITAAGLPCTLADARMIGTAKEQQPDGRKVNVSYFELACNNALGYILAVREGTPKPAAFTCLETAAPGPDGKPSALRCALPGNQNINANFQVFVTKANLPCTVSNARAIGQTTTAALFELACSEGGGYILTSSAPPNPDQPAQFTTCLAYDGSGNVFCTLTDRAQGLLALDRLVARSDRATCQVKDRRYVLSTRAGANYYEFACNDGKGFIMEVDAQNTPKRTIDCATADFIGGGCTLTDARSAQTEQAGIYTGLATRAGYNCQVEKYAPLPVNVRGVDVVEMKCSNRPDGAIGRFPVSGAPEIIDCAHAPIANYRCTFTPAAAAFPSLTNDLKSFNRNSCAVSDSRFVGTTTEGKSYIEVACADGMQGYLIEYTRGPPMTVSNVIVCSQARGIGGGCKLATNVTPRPAAASAPPAGR
ncbi:MAG: hypothetical protein U1E50_05835 [Caulobacteraceae bacterium]